MPVVVLVSIVAFGALLGVAFAWPPRLGHARRALPPSFTLILFAALAALMLCAMYDRDWAPPAAAFCAGIAFGFLLRADPSRDRSREAGILRELAEGVRLKMPLQPHVEAMMKEYRGELVLRLQRASLALSAGCALSEALARGGLLPTHALAAVRAGETGGGAALARTLDQGACDLLRERSHRHALWLAVLYPLGTWLLVLPFACFLKFYLFDRFTYLVDYLQESGFSAEWAYWNEMAAYLILVGFALVALFLVVGFSKPAGAPSLLGPTWVELAPAWRWLHARLPVFGNHYYHACLARAARTLSALVAAETPLHAALREAAHPEIAGPHARDLLLLAETSEHGVPLREALAETRLPSGLKTLMLNGAEAGELAEALDLAAGWHESRARRLERVMQVLLPCVTIPLVGAFVAAFYIPFLWMLFEIKTHLPPMR